MLDRVEPQIQSDAMQQAPDIAVSFRNVEFSIDGKRLLHKLNCEIGKAGKTVIMGPNGAGKSIFLRMIAGLLKPESGEIFIPPNDSEQQRSADISIVFQNPVLLRRSVSANIAYVLKQQGHSKKTIARLVSEALVQAKLEDRAQMPARQLSGGEQQRLAMARALVMGSSILLLDEATANLDPASTFIVEEMVDVASRAGTKIIFITHDVRQAKRVGDDILFLHKGRILAHKPKDAFFKEPGSEEAQAYLDGRVIE